MVGHKLVAGVDDPGAIRPDDADAVPRGDRLDLGLAGPVAHLREAGRDDHRGFDAGLAALLQHACYRGRGRRDHRQVNRRGDGADRRVARHAECALSLRVDHERVAVAALQHLPEQLKPDLTLGHRADERDVAGVEEMVEGHGCA